MSLRETGQDIWMKIFEKTGNIVSRKIAGELFLVPVSGELADMQRMFALTPVAEFIWEQLDGRTNIDKIRSDVVARFQVDEEQASSDIQEFMAELLQEGLAREVVA
jgi:hypothetical protein